MGIGVMEVLFILLIAFILFGPRRLPEIARGLGKAMRELKKYSSALTSDLTDEFNKELVGHPDDVPNRNTQAAKEETKSPDVTPEKAEEIQPLNRNE